MFHKDLSLTNLINLEEWQRIQDLFSEVLEVTLRTVSPRGELISRVSRPNQLCSRISPNNPAYPDFCGSCVLQNDPEVFSEIKDKSNVKCSLGVDLFVIPLIVAAERPIAFIIVGPLILNRRKEISKYAEDAAKIGVQLEDLMDALVEINVFSHSKVYAVTKLVRDVLSHMVQTAYHKQRLGEMAPEIMKMDPLFLRYYEEKILTAMLSACMLGLDADSGSVMTVDKKTERLHIKAANKIDKEIVETTNLKLGEGIAGLAAQKAEPIILPEDQTKNNLTEKMKRSYIKSSMIVPFPKGKGHNVYGVINLNMLRKNINFSQKDIAFVQELLNLASTALIPFQANNSHPQA
ncbi:PocR ligand-binding domain-containing protein [Candidatus Omnitrophota bacterium]